MKTSIVIELKKCGSNIDQATVTNEQLVSPSIFDNDNLKELKSLLQDILMKVQETKDQDEINE